MVEEPTMTSCGTVATSAVLRFFNRGSVTKSVRNVREICQLITDEGLNWNIVYPWWHHLSIAYRSFRTYCGAGPRPHGSPGRRSTGVRNLRVSHLGGKGRSTEHLQRLPRHGDFFQFDLHARWSCDHDLCEGYRSEQFEIWLSDDRTYTSGDADTSRRFFNWKRDEYDRDLRRQ